MYNPNILALRMGHHVKVCVLDHPVKDCVMDHSVKDCVINHPLTNCFLEYILWERFCYVTACKKITPCTELHNAHHVKNYIINSLSRSI